MLWGLTSWPGRKSHLMALWPMNNSQAVPIVRAAWLLDGRESHVSKILNVLPVGLEDLCFSEKKVRLVSKSAFLFQASR